MDSSCEKYFFNIGQRRVIEDDDLRGMTVSPKVLVILVNGFGNIAQPVGGDNKVGLGIIHRKLLRLVGHRAARYPRQMTTTERSGWFCEEDFSDSEIGIAVPGDKS